MHYLYPAVCWLRHWLLEIDEHSLHGPFLFDLYTRVFSKARTDSGEERLENIRQTLKKSNTKLNPGSLGAGSRLPGRQRRIGRIARHGITPMKYSLLYRELIRYFDLRHILELGTSIGLNTLYLAGSTDRAGVWTLEGDPDLLRISEELFREHDAKHIETIQGDIGTTLPAFLERHPSPDFILFDANHTLEATWQYYALVKKGLPDTAVLVFDDIYWSKEMTTAWRKICADQRESLCLDLFRSGIIIRKKDISPGYYHLAF